MAQWLVQWWTSSSVIWLLVIAGACLHGGLPLPLGVFGRETVIACAVTLALPGIAGLVVRQRNARLGAGLIGGYSIVWLIALLAALPRVWRASWSICFAGLDICVTSPMLAGVMSVLAIAFSLVALWSGRRCLASY